MIPWLSLLFEAGLATLMAALIVYCVKLNRRLSVLRSQDTEIRELIAGLSDASERAEVSVQRLKAAGLAAERSLRAAIEDAARTQAGLGQPSQTRHSAKPAPAAKQASNAPASGEAAAAARPPHRPGSGGKESAASAGKGSPTSARKESQSSAGNGRRDMLMAPSPPSAASDSGALPERPKTREEAEETLLQAIRSARAGV